MKEELKQYQQRAISTESRIDKVKLNPMFLLSVLTIAKAAGDMLDQIKKHAFYGREYSDDRLQDDFLLIVGGLEGVKQTFKDINQESELGIDPRVFHAILGMATESTELLEALDIMGGEMDTVNLLEESFDIDWYQFILLDALGGDMEQLWETGLTKLEERFKKGKFSAEEANNRDLDAEREILNTLDKNPLDEENISHT